MSAKEIHYYLLSLFVRGLGFWLLFNASFTVYALIEEIYKWNANEGGYVEGPPLGPLFQQGFNLIVRVGIAVS
jgi:hypothetical protein